MESERLRTEIGQRNELLFKIDAETTMVEKVWIKFVHHLFVYFQPINSNLVPTNSLPRIFRPSLEICGLPKLD